ncbi:unnamed protein product, partial [Porites evermanni]
DTEAPTFVSCPADIVVNNATENIIRVNWKLPVFTDNSGNVSEVITNMQPGFQLTVPGSYEVIYTATDKTGNKNKNCSFRITLEFKQCPRYAPPKNGALTCNTILSQEYCSVQCQSGYDFVSTPPFVYFCDGGEWQFQGFGHNFDRTLPWPDCASKCIMR